MPNGRGYGTVFKGNLEGMMHRPEISTITLQDDGWKSTFLLRLSLFKGFSEFPGCILLQYLIISHYYVLLLMQKSPACPMS